MSASLEHFAASCLFPGLVSGLMASSLYIFYYQFCEPLLMNQPTTCNGIILTLIAIFLWCMSMICYMQVLRISPGNPKKISTFDSHGDKPLQLISICQENGQPRYCHTCKTTKPDRSHHCRVCNVCVLKMDHHCSWINGCVGYHNHKIFFLFLLYTFTYLSMLFYHGLCLILETTTLRLSWTSLKFIWTMYKGYFVGLWTIIWNLWRNAWSRTWIPLLTGAPSLDITIKYQIIFMTYLTFIFCTFLLGLTVIQASFILRNRTTLEQIASYEQYIRLDLTNSSLETDKNDDNFEVICLFPPEKNLYDLGAWKNWKSVMGNVWYLWFVPIQVHRNNTDDGHVFAYGDQVYSRLVGNLGPSSGPPKHSLN